MKYIVLALLLLLQLSIAHQDSETGIMISHGVRRTMRMLTRNKLRCVIMHINPPFQEVVVFKTFAKQSSFKEVSDSLDYTTPGYMACWFTYEDQNEESHSQLVFALYNPVYAIGSVKDAAIRYFSEVVEKLGIARFSRILQLSNSDMDETLIIKKLSNK